MNLLSLFAVIFAASVSQASPCAKGTLVTLTDVFCIKATCTLIQGTEVDTNGKPGATRNLRTGAFQTEIRENLEYWEARCETAKIPIPCVDGEYCVDESNTVIGYPAYNH